MREIIFRGKIINSDKWIEGSLIQAKSVKDGHLICFIAPFSEFYTGVKEVIPSTIGQYTGLTDKNGTKIFEGDILKFLYNENDKEPTFFSVEWKIDRACFGYAETADKMIEVDCLHCEVIGNIHDNKLEDFH